MKHYLATICATLLLVAGIGCSENTTAPETMGNNGGASFEDVPVIPRPVSPGGSVPATSEIHTTLKRFAGTFNPLVERAYGHWNVDFRIFSGAWTPLSAVNAWSDTFTGGGFAPSTPLGHLLMVSDGSARSTVTGTFTYGSPSVTYRYRFSGESFDEPVYIRRDRQWHLKSLEGGAGDFLLLDGNVQGTISTSYTQGTSTTQTEEFGRSVTASASAGIGPLSASVSGTLSETFSTSVTVESARTETFEKTVTGKEGKIIQFQVWELVDTYSFSDAEGNRLTDDDYELVNTKWVRRGSAAFLQATEFDR